MLFDERYFRLYSQLNIGEGCGFAQVWGHPGQNPSTTLLVHQASCSINWIGYHSPGGIDFPSSARQNNFAAGQSLGNQDNGSPCGNLPFEQIDQYFFADTIHGIDRIAVTIAIFDDTREVRCGRLLASSNDRIADFFVDGTYGVKKQSRIRHEASILRSGSKKRECRKTNRQYLKKEVDSLSVSFYGLLHFHTENENFKQQKNDPIRD